MKKPIITVLLLCLTVCLAGCGSKAEQQKEPVTEITVVPGEEDYELLSATETLEKVDFTGSTDYENIFAWAAEHPAVEVVYTVTMPDGTVLEQGTEDADISGYAESERAGAAELLRYLPELKTIKAGSYGNGEMLAALAESFPGVKVEGSFTVNGKEYTLDSSDFDLTGVSSTDAAMLMKLFPVMDVKHADLGDESTNTLSWEEIKALEDAAPSADFDYSFTLYGREMNFETSAIDLRKYPIDDEGALISRIVPCMQGLETLDMDHTGVSDEAMAAIRDANPGVNVIWRIFFGERYSVRTDVERILASNPGPGGELTDRNTVSLKYCTKVKYMDLGHSDQLHCIDFVSYMPDLEVAVFGISGINDVTPLADCPKLEFLELEYSAVNDISPLANLTNLRHLNLAYCLALYDLTPIYGLTDLEKLWIGNLTPISSDQIDAFQALAPNTKINRTCYDNINGLSEGWRYVSYAEDGTPLYYPIVEPRYDLLRHQLEYYREDAAYAYYWNDPLY